MPEPLFAKPCIVLVGSTGVGKSSALAAIKAVFPELVALPGRRELTDERIIPCVENQYKLGLDTKDRLHRFKYTRLYQQDHPGGMAEVLQDVLQTYSAGLHTTESVLVFDSLRGRREVDFALKNIPGLVYLALSARPGVRLLRLLNRGDAFDRTQFGGIEAAEELLHNEPLISLSDRRVIVELLRSGKIQAQELRAKLAIIKEDAAQYDELAALELLRLQSTKSVFLVDSSDLEINTTQEIIKDFLLGVKHGTLETS